jgi:glycosyltransferase involved in cell wall biosynthesis
VSVTGSVFLLTSEPPDGGGGVEHWVREMARGLEARGFQIEIFHRGNSEPSWLATRTGRLSRKFKGTLLGYWVGRNAQRHLRKGVAAVISNGDIGYFPLRSGSQFRRIHFFHGTYRGQTEAIRDFIGYGGYLYMKWWNSMVLERLSGRGKTILTCSEQASQEVARFFGQSSVAVWLPIDTEHFRPHDVAASRTALDLPSAKTIGLFVGNIQPAKGFPTIRAMIDQLPEIHWVLALRGDTCGNEFTRSNLTIMRDVPHERIPKLYSAADFTVCPSLYESFGYVVAEALACGTPVIASPGGASRLFLREPPINRLLISNPTFIRRFVDAVREVLDSPGSYRRVVIERVRPRIQELMAPQNWWRRFFEVTGL